MVQLRGGKKRIRRWSMTTQAKLAEYDILTPSELKRFGKRVKLFSLPENYEPLTFEEAKKRLFKEIEDFVVASGGQLYTGIHKENDWSRTFWWDKGAHLVNRTLEFAVVVPPLRG
jgi:hypothetical protein